MIEEFISNNVYFNVIVGLDLLEMASGLMTDDLFFFFFFM